MIHIASREATSLETQAWQDATVSPDDHSEREPPDPMPNSEVKPLSADGSVEFLPCESRSSSGTYTEPPLQPSCSGGSLCA